MLLAECHGGFTDNKAIPQSTQHRFLLDLITELRVVSDVLMGTCIDHLQ